MADSAPDFTEQQLLAMYDRIDAKITNIENNLLGQYGGPVEQASRIEEAKRLRDEVISRLGYQPKSALDKEMEDLKGKIDRGEPIRDDMTSPPDWACVTWGIRLSEAPGEVAIGSTAKAGSLTTSNLRAFMRTLNSN